MWQVPFKPHDIDLELNFDCFVFSRATLDRLQQVLVEVAPRWAAGLHEYVYRESKRPVPVDVPGALFDEVRRELEETGPLDRPTERGNGAPGDRLVGSLELRGGNASLTVVLCCDEQPFRRIGGDWLFGNSIALQVRRPRVEGVPAAEWSRRAFRRLCEVLDPSHGFGAACDEFDAKNMSNEGGGLEAIGRDISRYLPGLYWTNFFGPRYADFIGRDRLLSAPALSAERLGRGVLLELSADPAAWRETDYRSTRRAVLEHLGRNLFFDRSLPHLHYTAPPLPGSPER